MKPHQERVVTERNELKPSTPIVSSALLGSIVVISPFVYKMKRRKMIKCLASTSQILASIKTVLLAKGRKHGLSITLKPAVLD